MLVCILAVLAAGCGNDNATADAKDWRSVAEALSDSGQTAEAIAAMRRAIAGQRSSAALRLRLAQLYIDDGSGALAWTTLDQAERLGASANETAVLRARALLLQQRYHELLAFPSDPGWTPPTRLQVEFLRTRANALLSAADSLDPAITARYAALLAQFAEASDAGLVADLRAQLDAERRRRPALERAWQHHFCRLQPSRLETWAPVAVNATRRWQVGPTRELKMPSDAARLAADGDLVEIDPGNYPGGVAAWPQNGLVVRGVGQRPVITAEGKAVQQRDVWLFTGNDVVVENVEISGARSPWRNGAAIRHIGSGLTLRNVFLHDNENGLLTGNRTPGSRILVEYSEFAHNGDGEGYAHNIYVGRAGELEMRFSYSHESRGGHLIKSRAARNRIVYNRLSDNDTGQSSYLVDLPEGGSGLIMGNVIQHGHASLNHIAISYGSETQQESAQTPVIAYNTFYNRHLNAIVIRNAASRPIEFWNNLLAGAPMDLAEGPIRQRGNLVFAEHGLSDPHNYDFSLRSGARAIDSADPVELLPEYEYRHPVQGQVRPVIFRPDVGAHERCGL